MGDLLSKIVFKSGQENVPEPPKDFFLIKMNDINGKEIDFADYRGKHRAFLIVNVASKCGLTDTNYKELVRLDDQY